MEPLKPLADMLSGPGQHQSGAYYLSLREDGTPVSEDWDGVGGHPLIEGAERISAGPRQGHYPALFLVKQYRRDGNRRYLESARRYAEWAIGLYYHECCIPDSLVLDESGQWEPEAGPDVASPGAIVRVLLALHEADGNQKWIDAARELSEWSMRWQRRQPHEPDIDGAIMPASFVVSYHVSFAAWGLLELARYMEARTTRETATGLPPEERDVG